MFWHLVVYRLLSGSLLHHGPPGASSEQPASPRPASLVAGESAPGTTPPSSSSLTLVSVGLCHIFSLLSLAVVQSFFHVSYIGYYRGATTFAG